MIDPSLTNVTLPSASSTSDVPYLEYMTAKAVAEPVTMPEQLDKRGLACSRGARGTHPSRPA